MYGHNSFCLHYSYNGYKILENCCIKTKCYGVTLWLAREDEMLWCYAVTGSVGEKIRSCFGMITLELQWLHRITMVTRRWKIVAL